jgi:methyl-accepting chemotaxis protein
MARRFSRWHSIPVRIVGGFGALILVLIAVAAATWRAENSSEVAALADKSAESRSLTITAASASLADVRLNLADYLRSGAGSDRDALAASLAAFDEAIKAAVGDADGATKAGIATLADAATRLKKELAASVDAAIERRNASAQLLETVKQIGNGLSALSAAGARSSDRAVADATSAAIVAGQRPITEAVSYDSREAAIARQSTLDGIAELRTSLAAILSATADPPARLRRLTEGLEPRLEELSKGVARVDRAITARSDRQSAMARSIIAARAAMRDVAAITAADRLLRQQEMVAARQSVRRTLLVAVAVGCFVGGILATLVGLSITRPLKRIALTMRQLADGAPDIDVPDADRRDEVGQMAGAVQVFKDNMNRTRELDAEQERLKGEVTAERRRTLDSMATSFERQVGDLVARLAAGAQALEETAKAMTANASDTNEQATLVAQAALQADAGIQTVAAAAEELAASIGEINRQMGVSSAATEQAVSLAATTGGVVRDLDEAASRVGQVVGLIADIAGRTNLLALNATIEASRAGEAGKGFAVVASEVKTLATQTARATKDITEQIGQIQTTTRDAVSAIHGIAEAIRTAATIATSIAAAVEQQGAATSEISGSVQTTAAATQDLSGTIGNVKQIAGETGQAAHRVLDEAAEVASQSRELAREVAMFIATVRAA